MPGKSVMDLNSLLRTTFSACSLAALAVLGGCSSARAPVDANVYHGFTLIDPATQTRVENAWIVVEGNRLSKVGSGQPPESESADLARVHDLTGRFVLPGFIDAHAH